MILKKVSLTDFRSFSSNIFYFNPFLTVIVGENSVGKTNILEGIFLILSGQGIKDEHTEDLISFQKKTCSICAEFAEEDDIVRALIHLKKNENSTTRAYSINKVPSTLNAFSLHTPPGVLFTPQRIESLTTEPSRRRKLFDMIISTHDSAYRQALANYQNGLYRRNRILEQGNTRSPSQLNRELLFWDEFLVTHGEVIQQKRSETIAYMNKNSRLGEMHFAINYVQSPLSLHHLRDTLEEQLKKKRTISGPQRDDFSISLLKDKVAVNILTFGSRSQQRLALLWILLNELVLYREKLNARPILLLDDIFSELDGKHVKLVIKAIRSYQTILTTVDPITIAHIDVPKSIVVLK